MLFHCHEIFNIRQCTWTANPVKAFSNTAGAAAQPEVIWARIPSSSVTEESLLAQLYCMGPCCFRFDIYTWLITEPIIFMKQSRRKWQPEPLFRFAAFWSQVPCLNHRATPTPFNPLPGSAPTCWYVCSHPPPLKYRLHHARWDGCFLVEAGIYRRSSTLADDQIRL